MMKKIILLVTITLLIFTISYGNKTAKPNTGIKQTIILADRVGTYIGRGIENPEVTYTLKVTKINTTVEMNLEIAYYETNGSTISVNYLSEDTSFDIEILEFPYSIEFKNNDLNVVDIYDDDPFQNDRGTVAVLTKQ